MHTEDGYFIQKCLLGEPGAFSFLIEKYKTAVYSLAYSKLGNFHDAQDIAQEAFVKAYRKLSTLKRTDKFRPWIYAITSNLCIDFLRSQSSRPDSEYAEDIDEDILEQPAISAYQKELNYDALREALGELPEIYRQVISLYYLGDMKSKEIAQFLGTSVTNINARLSRARALLKEEMITMMSTTFDEVRLQPGFTFRVVEAVKRTKIQSAPYKPALPFGISATGIMIALMLSMAIPQSPLYPIGELIGSALPSQTQVPEIGVIPVDTVEVTEITILSSEKGDGDFGKKPMPKPTNFAGAGKWERKVDMPTPRFSLSTAGVELNGKIYAIGGWNGQVLSTVEEYDPVNNTWREKADMPTPRCALATVVVNGKIYAIGGSADTPGKLNMPLATIEEYDPVTDKWTKKADMPTSRNSFSASVVDGKIYVIGGYNGGRLSSMEEYDPVTDKWSQKAPINVPRNFLSTSVVNGKIYAMGGIAGGLVVLSTVEEYDPVTDTWTKRTDMPTPRSAFGISAVKEKIYVIGGAINAAFQMSKTVEEYDTVTDSWTKRNDISTARVALSASAINGKIYAIGGGPVIGWTSIVEEYDTGERIPQSVNPAGKLTTTWGEIKTQN